MTCTWKPTASSAPATTRPARDPRRPRPMRLVPTATVPGGVTFASSGTAPITPRRQPTRSPSDSQRVSGAAGWEPACGSVRRQSRGLSAPTLGDAPGARRHSRSVSSGATRWGDRADTPGTPSPPMPACGRHAQPRGDPPQLADTETSASRGLLGRFAAVGVRSVLFVLPTAAVTVCLSLQAVVLSPTPASGSGPLVVMSAADPVAVALDQAEATGARVEVTSERTETDTVWANPSGTVTQEISVSPVRVATGAGWVPVDYSLRQVGGRLEPVASDADVSFAAGDAGDLVSMNSDGSSFALDWPGVLPTPSVAGDTATYRNVLPGVDLLMTAVPGVHRDPPREGRRRSSEPGVEPAAFPHRD